MTVDFVALTAGLLLLGIAVVYSIYLNGVDPTVEGVNGTLASLESLMDDTVEEEADGGVSALDELSASIPSGFADQISDVLDEGIYTYDAGEVGFVSDDGEYVLTDNFSRTLYSDGTRQITDNNSGATASSLYGSVSWNSDGGGVLNNYVTGEGTRYSW